MWNIALKVTVVGIQFACHFKKIMKMGLSIGVVRFRLGHTFVGKTIKRLGFVKPTRGIRGAKHMAAKYRA